MKNVCRFLFNFLSAVIVKCISKVNINEIIFSCSVMFDIIRNKDYFALRETGLFCIEIFLHRDNFYFPLSTMFSCSLEGLLLHNSSLVPVDISCSSLTHSFILFANIVFLFSLYQFRMETIDELGIRVAIKKYLPANIAKLINMVLLHLSTK